MLSSCNKDDDDNNGGGGSNVAGNSTSLVKDGNVLLTSVDDEDGQTVFKYDEKLRPVYAYDYYYDYAYKEEYTYDLFFIDYKTGKIKVEGDEGFVSFNDKGYITKIQTSWNYTENEDGHKYVYRGSMTTVFKYDGNGHLISMDGTGEDYTEYDGYKEYEKGGGKAILTWNNGNLTKMETNSEYRDEKGNVIEKSNLVETFAYSDKINKHKQYFDSFYNNDYYFWYVGLLGVGPEKLPLTYHSKEVYERKGEVNENGEEKFEREQFYEAEFTLNENGSINTETWTDTETSWSWIAKYNYTPIDEYKPGQTKALVSPYKTKSTTTGKGKHIRNLLKYGLFKSMRKN